MTGDDKLLNKTFYYFYCIKEDTGHCLNKTIFKDVIKVDAVDKKEARKIAKEIMFSKHQDIPQSFRKTTNKYFYLEETSSFYYMEIDKFECKMCGKTKEPYQGINDYYIKNGFCSYECFMRYKKLKEEIYKNELSFYLDEDYNAEFIDNKTSDTKGYIYLITNKRTEKVYIGQTSQIPIFRWWQHIKSDDHKFERNDITDLIFEVIEIVYAGNSKELKRKLYEREDYYIQFYNSLTPNGYNLVNAKKRENDLRQLILDLNFEEHYEGSLE